MKVAIRALKTNAPFKILDVSGEAGSTLKNHKVNQGAVLLMRSGSIIYKEENRTKVLSAGETCDIPAEVFHKVTCTTKAKFFVVLPDHSKMEFEK